MPRDAPNERMSPGVGGTATRFMAMGAGRLATASTSAAAARATWLAPEALILSAVSLGR